MSELRPHLASGFIDEPAPAWVHSCNRLGRQATPPSRNWALTNWWRRATRRSRER